MSFQDELAGIKRMSVEKRGAEVIAAYERGVDELRADGIAGRALAIGDTMPGFARPSAVGATVRSADLLGRGPLVVTFYRGGWCPYCNLELRAYQAQAARLAAAGATVVAISPEVPDETAKTAATNALAFDVLSDAGNAVARSFGLVFQLSDELVEIYRRNGNDLEKRNGDGSWELPVPGTFVVGTDGRVVLADADPDYTRRLDPEQVIAAVERLAR